MREDTWRPLEAVLAKWAFLVAPAASVEEIEEASATLGLPFPADYKEFLLRTGGAYVGGCQIYGTRTTDDMSPKETVTQRTQDYRDYEWPGVEEWIIICMDGRGNPLGIAPDGKVWRSDHDVGDIMPIADSFEDFIRRECLRLE